MICDLQFARSYDKHSALDVAPRNLNAIPLRVCFRLCTCSFAHSVHHTSDRIAMAKIKELAPKPASDDEESSEYEEEEEEDSGDDESEESGDEPGVDVPLDFQVNKWIDLSMSHVNYGAENYR